MSSAKEVKDLFSATARRRLQGIQFDLKSESIEAAFKLLSDDRKVTHRPAAGVPGWGNVQYYQLEMGPNGIPILLTGYNKGRFDLWGHRELVHTRQPPFNLSMLLAVGLGEGVTITIPTVMSNTQLQAFLDGLKAGARQFYIDYLVERTRTIRITTEETES